jgi:endonuclease YncB( thermonuclease family)
VLRNSNLRGGPGTNYPIVGKAPAGTTVNVVEATADRTWYYLDGGNWIAAFLVELSAPLGPAEVWSVAPGQPAGVFTKVTTTLVTTVITTTVTTVDQDGTTIVTTTTTTSNPQAPGVEGPGASVPPTGLPGGSATVAAAPLGPGVAAAPGAVILGPLTPTLVISQLLPTDVQSATLVSVVEGDVIQVDINGVREIVRYLGVDAPEVSQLGGATATAANRRLVEGEEILLQREQTDRDAQNRLLRHVYVVDRSVSNFFNGGFAGIYVNGQLVADGWAVPGAVNPDVSRTPELERWALDAARAGRGFWGGSGGADNAVFALTRVSAPLFSGPGADNGADAVLAVDAPLKVFGRSPDGAWVQVRTPRLDEGWVFVPQLNLTGAIGQLPVTSNTSGPTPVPQPGQALVAPGTPSLPGQQPAATPFPGQPALVTPFPGQPAPMPGSPDPFGGQPAPAPFGPTVIITANLRSGPGTLYPIVGTALAGAPITITARSADGTWLQSSNSTWIATGLVTNISASTLPQFDAPPTPIPTMPPEPTPVLVVPPGATAPTPTITPTPSPTPTPLGNPTPTFTPVPPTPLVRLIALDRGNEWVILYNDGTGTQDLSGWTLVSETGDQRCPLQGDLAPRESLRVWAQVGPDGFSCGFAEPIWENAGPDAAVLLNAYGDEVSRIQ